MRALRRAAVLLSLAGAAVSAWRALRPSPPQSSSGGAWRELSGPELR